MFSPCRGETRGLGAEAAIGRRGHCQRVCPRPQTILTRRSRRDGRVCPRRAPQELIHLRGRLLSTLYSVLDTSLNHVQYALDCSWQCAPERPQHMRGRSSHVSTDSLPSSLVPCSTEKLCLARFRPYTMSCTQPDVGSSGKFCGISVLPPHLSPVSSVACAVRTMVVIAFLQARRSDFFCGKQVSKRRRGNLMAHTHGKPRYYRRRVSNC